MHVRHVSTCSCACTCLLFIVCASTQGAYSAELAYGQSKLAQILFTRELRARLQKKGKSGVQVRLCVFVGLARSHFYTVYLRPFWQGNHQTYSHMRGKHTVLANPMVFVIRG